MARKLPGRAIQAGTITVTQLDSATSTVIQTGGGPKITDVQVANNSWTVLDDTAVDTAGGYLVITGTGFVTGALVYFNQTAASAVTFMSSTTLRVTVPALTAGTYIVYVINPDGGSAIRVPGVTASASPAWQTASALPDQYDGVVITLGLAATDATSYAVTSGSLPPGLSLAANTGVISGTVTGVSNDTTYTFTVTATDAQNQDSPRTFTVTITVSDTYFRLTTLLLGGEQGNTVVRDSSVNNFNLTVFGDSRATNFTPYGTGWSNYFDGSTDYLSLASNAAFNCGTGNWTIEAWVYIISETNAYPIICGNKTATYSAGALAFGNHNTDQASYNNRFIITGYDSSLRFADPNTHPLNTWIHIAVVRDSATTLKMFRDGTQVASTTIASGYTFDWGQSGFVVGGGNWDGANRSEMHGFISNLRVIKGTALYTANFTPATTTLTAVANTSLLTCHVNSFRDGSTNNFVITRNGDAAVRSFNPFGITNTGDSGSMYFDGTGDYLSLTNSSALAFGTNDFTVEFWSYLTVAKSAGSGMGFIHGTSGSGNFGMSTDFINIYAFTVGGSGLSFAYVPKVDRWTHYAFVRSSGSAKLYVDGVQVGTSQSYTTNITGLTGSTYVGAETGPTNYYTGYLTGLRYVNGTAVYTANFTPATTSLTAIANTQLLTLQYRQPHNNHGFQDSSSNNFLITRNGNASQGTFSPFSQTGWSVYFIGSSSSYLSLAANANLAMGTSSFTVEAFFYLTSSTTNQAIFTPNGSNNGLAINIVNSTSIFVDQYGSGGITYTVPAITLNTWYHIAIVRNSTTTRVYLNGTESTTGGVSDSKNYSGQTTLVGAYSLVAGYYFTGYISNLRVVKGSAVYTANFTPPTTPLTAIANTQLLIGQSNRFVDNSTNAIVVTATNGPSVRAWSPFAPTAVYTPAVHGGSMYLDGTGDTLTIPANNAFSYSTGAFTIEAWIYSTGTGATRRIYHQMNTSSNQVSLLQTSTNKIQSYVSLSGVVVCDIQSTNTIQANTWNHVAFVRSGSSFALFINGNREGTATSASSAPDAVTSLYIGTTETSEYWLGYISNLRAIKGTAVYDPTQTNITVPTAPVTATTNTQLLLNFTDAAILDRTGRAVLETVADAKSSSVQVKYGTGAVYFDGTGDYLTIPAPPGSPLDFKSSDFTIEAWINYSAVNATICGIYRIGDGNIIQYYFGINGTNKLEGILYASGASYNSFASSGSVSTNTWTHVAFTRSTNTLRLFINGVLDGTTTVTVGDLMTLTAATKFSVGASSTLGPPAVVTGFFNGYIDDLRVTKGYARYTANFTPPTASHRLK